MTGVADDTRYHSAGHGTESTHAITAVRYSIDAPSWVSGTDLYPLQLAGSSTNPAVRNFDGFIDTGGLAPGRHLLLVESQDATGNWGVPSATFLQVDAPALTIETSGDAQIVLRWPTASNLLYDVEFLTQLPGVSQNSFSVLTSRLPASPTGVQSFTNATDARPATFYRLRAYPQ